MVWLYVFGGVLLLTPGPSALDEKGWSFTKLFVWVIGNIMFVRCMCRYNLNIYWMYDI